VVEMGLWMMEGMADDGSSIVLILEMVPLMYNGLRYAMVCYVGWYRMCEFEFGYFIHVLDNNGMKGVDRIDYDV